MSALDRIVRRAEDVVARRVADEDLLVPVRGHLADMQRIFALDPVAAFVWERLDGTASLGSIATGVVAAFAVEPERAAKDVAAFVASLEAAGLASAVTEVPGHG